MNLKSLLNKEITQQELLNYYNATISYIDLPDKIEEIYYLLKDKTIKSG